LTDHVRFLLDRRLGMCARSLGRRRAEHFGAPSLFVEQPLP
jgi:hypothetical protein